MYCHVMLFLVILFFFLLTSDYITEVMLSMCEIQDKGKGSYTEISTLLSEIQNIWLSKFRKV